VELTSLVWQSSIQKPLNYINLNCTWIIIGRLFFLFILMNRNQMSCHNRTLLRESISILTVQEIIECFFTKFLSLSIVHCVIQDDPHGKLEFIRNTCMCIQTIYFSWIIEWYSELRMIIKWSFWILCLSYFGEF